MKWVSEAYSYPKPICTYLWNKRVRNQFNEQNSLRVICSSAFTTTREKLLPAEFFFFFQVNSENWDFIKIKKKLNSTRERYWQASWKTTKTHTLQHQTWRRLQKKMGTKKSKKSRNIKMRTTIDGYQLIAAPLSKDRSWTIICIGHIQHLVHGHHPINFRSEVECTVARESMWWDTVYPPYNM